MLPWGHLWVGWNGAAIDPIGESVPNTELFRRLADAMGYTEPALFDDDDTLLRQALPTVDLDELRSVGMGACPVPRRWSTVRRRRVRHPVRSGRVRLRTRWNGWANRACRRSSRPVRARAATPNWWHGSRSSCSPGQ